LRWGSKLRRLPISSFDWDPPALPLIARVAVNPQQNLQQRALLFIENAVPAGIEPADPMITARREAYPVSFARRHAAAPQ
jgi:hypothetical protein